MSGVAANAVPLLCVVKREDLETLCFHVDNIDRELGRICGRSYNVAPLEAPDVVIEDWEDAKDAMKDSRRSAALLAVMLGKVKP